MPAHFVVTEFVSLDGVMEALGGEPDFKVYEPQPIRSGTDREVARYRHEPVDR